MSLVKVGVYLPAFGVEEATRIASRARHAEDVGLESVWIGDYLIPVRPHLDCTLVLAMAAATTERIKIGFGVMILALRPVAWAAKQVATLQHLSNDRVLLGIGSSGAVHGDPGWRAVGVPYRERGRRTDAALKVLPSLITGKPTMVDGEEVTLAPGSAMPPVLIAGGPATLRRVARYGDDWYPAFLPPKALAAAARQLAGLAAEEGRPAPAVTVNVNVGLGNLSASVIDSQVRSLTGYGITEEESRQVVITGTPAQAAERFAKLVEAGVDRLAGFPFAGDRFRQAALLAEAGRLVNE